MKINAKTRRQLKFQHGLFYVLMIVVAVLLTQVAIKTNTHFDWTSNQRHSLSKTTKQFLAQLDSPVTIQAFISPNNAYQPLLDNLLKRYQTHSDQLDLHYIDPDFSPDLVKLHNIQQQGEIIISKGEHRQHVLDLSEQSITNALMAVSREQEQWLVFIEGHGERRPDHQANFNLSTWANSLKQKGLKLKTLNLAEHPHIPKNTAAIVIASPEKPWLAGEIDIIKNYIAGGGNLLWLTEPEQDAHLQALAEYLSIEQIEGVIIDPNTAFLGISDPQFALISEYANHPISQAVSGVTLYPKATALSPLDDNNSRWQYQALLTTTDNVWSDIEPSQQAVFDQGDDLIGPLNLGYLLTPKDQEHQQRIAIIGDGDFLSNSYIGNAANIELGVAIIDWLVHEDSLISIPIKATPDKKLELGNVASLFIGLGFFIGLPALLLLTGLAIWWYRRKQ